MRNISSKSDFEFQGCAQVCKTKVLSRTRRKLDGVKWVKEDKLKKKEEEEESNKGQLKRTKKRIC